MHLEDIFLRHLRSEDASAHLDYIKANYPEDINLPQLLPQIDIFKVLMNGHDTQTTHFCYILKDLSPGQNHLIREVVVACKLVLVYPATNATSERMFSSTYNDDIISPPPTDIKNFKNNFIYTLK